MAFIRGALLLGACAILSCAGVEPKDGQPDRLPRATGSCLRISDIRQHRALDHRRILVYTHRETYLIEIAGYCSSLNFMEELRFSTRDSRICDYRMDYIVGRDERCSIGSIRPYIDPDQQRLEEEIDAEGDAPPPE